MKRSVWVRHGWARGWAAGVFAFAGLFLLALWLSPPTGAGAGVPSGTLVAHFIDVGQGDATLLAGPDFTIMIDAGRHDRNDVVPYLESAGVERIDLLIGTHPHADHIGQFPQVLQRFPVAEVWLPGTLTTTRTFERALDAILASNAAYHEPRAGEVFHLGSARLEVLNPAQVTQDINGDSIAVRVVFGEIAILFTGDAEAPTEREILDRGGTLRSDILQVGHHGSRTSSTTVFLQAVQPALAVYSAAKGNDYGHPHPETLERFAALGIPLLGTETYGTIIVETDGHTWTLRTEQGGAGPLLQDPNGGGEPGCAPGQVDVNSAPLELLVTIRHIGPERAEELIRLRPFATLDELTRIPGIGPARLDDIREQGLACVGPAG